MGNFGKTALNDHNMTLIAKGFKYPIHILPILSSSKFHTVSLYKYRYSSYFLFHAYSLTVNPKRTTCTLSADLCVRVRASNNFRILTSSEPQVHLLIYCIYYFNYYTVICCFNTNITNYFRTSLPTARSGIISSSSSWGSNYCYLRRGG